MDTLASIFSVAMVIVVQMGLPVVVIFIMGYQTERAARRRSDPRWPDPWGGNHRERLLTWLASDEKVAQATRQMGLCASAAGSAQSPLDRPALPCWQTAKSASGRLRSECLRCGAFLAPPALR